MGGLVDVELKPPKRDEPAQAVYEVKLLTAQEDLIKVRIDATSDAFLEADGEDLAQSASGSDRSGDGFGLPITRELAELHGGSLSMEPSRLGGLAAVLTLPAAS